MADNSQSQAVVKRGPGGRFLPGHAPKSPGRGTGTRNVEGLLNDALKQAGRLRATLQEPCVCGREDWIHANDALTKAAIYARSCKTIDQHYARRAFLDDTVLNAFQKKRIPDLIRQTGETPPTQVNVIYGHQALMPKGPVAEAMPEEAGHERDA